MSAKVWLAAMVAGTVLVILAGARHHTPPPRAAPAPATETPWLTREAADQILGGDAGMGPLFAGVVLGGTPPLPAVRERIAAFAKQHGVQIDFEIVDDEVRAVRFAVMFGGCCGYEGADSLGRRLGRPRTGSSCMGEELGWLDDWTITSEDRAIHMRARVRVNRVMLRWEPVATVPELLESAERLLGADREDVSRAATDRWIEIEPGKRYRLEVPHPLRAEYWRDQALGLDAIVDKGRVSEVSFTIRDRSDDTETAAAAMKARWGRPRVRGGDEPSWTWTRSDRIIRAALDGDDRLTTVTLARR